MYESGNIQREPFQLLKLSSNSNIIVPSRNCSFSSLRGFFSKLFPIFVFNEECLKDLILCFKLKSFGKWRKLFNVGRVLVGILMLFSSNTKKMQLKLTRIVFWHLITKVNLLYLPAKPFCTMLFNYLDGSFRQNMSYERYYISVIDIINETPTSFFIGRGIVSLI